MPTFVDRIGRSWRLVKASAAVLRSDSELLVLPVISGAISLLLAGGMVAIAMHDGIFDALKEDPQSFAALDLFYLWLFLFYIVQYIVILFFNTALVAGALERLDGRDPTLRSALSFASQRIIQIVGYAVIAATVGIFLRMLSERFGIVGKLLGAGASLAWAVTTFLVVPVIVAEGRGPFSAIGRSTELLRKTWGENIIGNAGISLVLGIFAALVAFFGIGGATFLIERGNDLVGYPMFAVAVLALIVLTVFSAALSAVFAASVYYYAVVGAPPKGFDHALIQDAFARKGAA